MSVKTRLSPKEKLRIFTESLNDSVKISEICRREEIWPNEYYRIKEKALSGALEALKNWGAGYNGKSGKRIFASGWGLYFFYMTCTASFGFSLFLDYNLYRL